MTSGESIVRDSLEKMISLRLIQADAEAISTLMQNEKDPIFCMAVMPYYALFIQSCQEYLGNTYIGEEAAWQVENIRNYIKAFSEGYSRSERRVADVDADQDKQFRAHLRFSFQRTMKMHYNIGIYATEKKYIVGNTQMYADCLGVEDIFSTQNKKKYFELAKQMGSFVASVRAGCAENGTPVNIQYNADTSPICYYYDFNTNKSNPFFLGDDKGLNLLFLNLLCNLNFVVKYLSRKFADMCTWVFRLEYIATYYAYRALCRLKNHEENSHCLTKSTKEGLYAVTEVDGDIFNSLFRGCMMHYGIEGRHILLGEFADRPFFGLVESCFDGLSFEDYLTKLRTVEERLIVFLSDQFDSRKITWHEI